MSTRAIQALRLKSATSYASIKKVSAMLACAGPHDNRIRGMLNHHGATTGRWTASLVQFQNMKRATIKNSDAAYRDICNGISREMMDIVYGPPLEVIGSCIRHFVHDYGECQDPHCDKGYAGDCMDCHVCNGTGYVERPFLNADFSAVEARIVNWLAGQEDALEEYRQGVDRYKSMASVIYGIPAEDVNKHPQRFVGKQAVLLCGFQGGAPKFRMTCKKYGYDLPIGLEEIAVKAFRAKHDKVVKYWYNVEKAAKRAILQKEEIISVRNISFLHRDIEGLPFLLLKLPSGRKLAYPRPRLIPSQRFEGATSIVYFGNILGTQWGDVTTYAGSLVENITQAVAADLMASGCIKAEAKGYETATLIHDEALSYYKDGQTVEEFVQCLTTLPDWAAGLPLEAEGALVPFYRKD